MARHYICSWALAAFALAMGTKAAQARALDLDRPVAFNIEAQRVGAALIEFSRQANIQILISPEANRAVQTPPIHKTIPPRIALDILLRHSGLKYSTVGGSVSITPEDHRPTPLHTADAANSLKGSSDSDGLTAAENAATAAQPTQTLEEVIVTAQKREERLQDVPISISALGGAALDRSTATDLFDEISRVPSVVIPPAGSQAGGSFIAVRGVAAAGVNGDGASPIAYYLDGAPFGFVRFAFIPDTNTFDLQRVEVLRGPQGTLYGANAEAGVVRVIPNEADLNGFDLKARAQGSYTEGGGPNGSGDLAVNVPLIEGKLAVRGVVDYQDWSGWIDRPGNERANTSQLRNFRFRANAQPAEDLTLGISYWGSRQHYSSPPSSNNDRAAPDTGPGLEPTDSNFDLSTVKIGYRSQHFLVSSVSSYLDYRTSTTLNLAPYTPALALFNNFTGIRSKVFSEELLLNSVNTGPWRWSVGAFYRDDRDDLYEYDVDATGQYIDNGFGAYFEDKSRSYAFFGELSRRFLDDKFEWTLGLRQFRDNVSTEKTDGKPPASYVAQAFNSTTPRVVLTWYPDPTLTVYSSFSEGFRSGVPQYYFVNLIDPSLPAAKPDKLYNYEVGAKTDLLDHRLSVDAAGYYIRWTGVQQAILIPLPDNLGQTNALVNGSSASGPGAEVSVTVRPTKNWSVGGTFSWNDLKMDADLNSAVGVLFHEGDRLNFSSKYTGSIFTSYSFPLPGRATGVLSASGNYISKQSDRGVGGLNQPYVTYGDNQLFARADLTVNFQNDWAIKLYGENLTNEYGAVNTGFVPGYLPTTDQFTARPRPRTFGLEVDYRYR